MNMPSILKWKPARQAIGQPVCSHGAHIVFVGIIPALMCGLNDHRVRLKPYRSAPVDFSVEKC